MTDADMKVLFAFLIGALIFAVLNWIDKPLKRSVDLMSAASATMASVYKDLENLREELEEFRRMLKESDQ